MSVKDVLNWTGDSSDLSPDDCGCLDWCYLAGGSTWSSLCCSFRCWRRFNRCWTEMCVCVGGGRPGAGTQFCSGHKPQREPRRVKNSRQVNNNNLICISNFEAAVCLVQRPMCSEVTLKYYVQLKFVETSLMWGNSAAYFSCISWRWSLSLDRPGGAKPRLKPAENPVDGECSSLTETDKVNTLNTSSTQCSQLPWGAGIRCSPTSVFVEDKNHRIIPGSQGRERETLSVSFVTCNDHDKSHRDQLKSCTGSLLWQEIII